MAEFLQVQLEISERQTSEQLTTELSQALQAVLHEIGVAEVSGSNDVWVEVEKPAPLAVEAAVVLALIGLSVKLIDLIMFLKKRRDEVRKLDLEKAKIEAQRVSEAERQRWRQEFVEQVLLAELLAKTGIRPVNVVVQVVER